VGAEEHRALLHYLDNHRDEFFSGTFLEVMKYISENL
jgi:hypothetical protein